MKKTLTVKHENSTCGKVIYREQIAENLEYKISVSYGLEIEGLQTIITRGTNSMIINIVTYAPTLGKALNIVQKARFNNYGCSIKQASIAMWK